MPVSFPAVTHLSASQFWFCRVRQLRVSDTAIAYFKVKSLTAFVPLLHGKDSNLHYLIHQSGGQLFEVVSASYHTPFISASTNSATVLF